MPSVSGNTIREIVQFSNKTNVFGTKNVTELADKENAEIFVLISTDKAVNPSSVMGATKRMAELINLLSKICLKAPGPSLWR